MSLDGASAATNDSVRGTGTFEAVVGRLRQLGSSFRFTLAFTIMKHNAHEVTAFAELGRALGAHTVVFRPLYPAGAARHRPELMPSFEQYSEALARLSDLGGVARGLDPFSPQARLATSAVIQGNRGCAAGNTIATISARGDVNPCSFLGPAFDVANVNDQPFAEIWRNGAGFREMRARSTRPGPDQFSGGCRARSLQLAGDIDAPDPWQLAWQQQQATTLPPGLTLPLGGTW